MISQSNLQTRKTRCKVDYEHPLTKKSLVVLLKERQEEEFDITTRSTANESSTTILDLLKRKSKFRIPVLDESVELSIL